MKEIKDILLEKINEADLVLVGIGEEFENNIPKMEDVPSFASAINQIEKNEDIKWMLPHLKKKYDDLNRAETAKKAYAVLENLLKDKNYFIVSTRIDDYIYQTNLLKERIVAPCGGYRFCHCADGCGKRLYESDRSILDNVYGYFMEGTSLDEIKRPLCPNCGKDLIFNNILSEGYVEEEYLEQWEKYMKWLQGTVNRKLCVLELGVGMLYPTVIRWPFEKVVYFNQKSNIFRIHSKLYQLTEEIKDRGYKIEKKPMDFLINWFV